MVILHQEYPPCLKHEQISCNITYLKEVVEFSVEQLGNQQFPSSSYGKLLVVNLIEVANLYLT